MTSFDEVVIMLHKFNSNSEHTFFTLQVIFGCLLKIVSCDKRLILKEHLTYTIAYMNHLFSNVFRHTIHTIHHELQGWPDKMVADKME